MRSAISGRVCVLLAWTVAVQCVGFSRIPSPRYDGQLATRLAAASTIPVTNAATQENSRRSLQIPITLSLLPCLSLPCAGSSWHPKALLSSRSPTQELSNGARRGCSTRREFGLCGSARVLQRAAPFGMSLFIPEEGAPTQTLTVNFWLPQSATGTTISRGDVRIELYRSSGARAGTCPPLARLSPEPTRG